MIIEAGAVFRNATLEPGWIEVRDGRIEAVGGGSAPTHPDCTYPEHILSPGFVDVHAHGGGGASFSTTSDADIDVVLASHLWFPPNRGGFGYAASPAGTAVLVS